MARRHVGMCPNTAAWPRCHSPRPPPGHPRTATPPPWPPRQRRPRRSALALPTLVPHLPTALPCHLVASLRSPTPSLHRRSTARPIYCSIVRPTAAAPPCAAQHCHPITGSTAAPRAAQSCHSTAQLRHLTAQPDRRAARTSASCHSCSSRTGDGPPTCCSQCSGA